MSEQYEERMHGDVKEHRHEGYEYWHPVDRKHIKCEEIGLPGYASEQEALDKLAASIANIVPPSKGEEAVPQEAERIYLDVKPFDWAKWDDLCESKDICQGYTSISVRKWRCMQCGRITTEQENQSHLDGSPIRILGCACGDHCLTEIQERELHHRGVTPGMEGIANAYWQCPHCRKLQQPIQRAQGARLESYWIEIRGSRVVLWLKTANQWFVLVTHGTIQSVANGYSEGAAYAVGKYPPVQLPDEVATILARRFWYKLTKGFWSTKRKEEETE